MFKTELLRYVNLNIQKEILYRNKLEKYATKVNMYVDVDLILVDTVFQN